MRYGLRQHNRVWPTGGHSFTLNFFKEEIMTQDEIIEMAKQADVWVVGQEPYQSQLERFAKLVAQHEREACAKICEEDAWRCKKIAVDTQNKQANASAIEASICASAIRARGNT